MPTDATRRAVESRLGVIGRKLVAHPSAVAVVTRETTWTAAALLDEVASASGWLAELVQANRSDRDDRTTAVPALLRTSVDALVTVLAGAVAGVPIAPLNPRSTPAELAAAIGPLRSGVVLHEQATAALAADVASTGVRTYDVASRSPRPPHVGSDDIAVLFHTSGTTGRPKPVGARRDALDARVAVYAEALILDAGARYWTGAPLHHVAGLAMHLMALGSGAQLVLEGDFASVDPDALVELAPTHCMLVPTVVDRWLEQGVLGLLDPAVLQYGGAPIDGRTLARLREEQRSTDLVQFFGQSEGSPITWLSPADHRGTGGWDGDPSVVGRAIDGVQLNLRDVRDETGELGARGEHFFVSGPDGWLWTGDIARIHDGGWVELRGRLADRIIRAGENVYPAEVEEVLRAHPCVLDVAVVGIPDRRLGQVVKAVVVLRDTGRPAIEDELVAHARAALSGYKVPAVWEFVDALPYTAAGKLLRRALAEPATVPS